MTLFDWWGLVGTGIQSAFAWMTFNRDAFADNVAMRQNQKYQQKNYQISWVAIARDDIRDMMGISVNRINNYMIVATLILSIAAGTVVGVSFDERCPGFLVNAFYLCMGTSLTFLLLAIMFGVSGQNSAFTNTMKLLTYQVRPENPAEYSHEYMQQAQWIEQNGVRSLFRIPGLRPNYRTDPLPGGLKDGEGRAIAGVVSPKEKATADVNLEDATPLESLVVRTTHTWYLTKFAQFMRLWHPYDTSSKYAMGLGIISLGQGTAYFSLGTLISHRRLDNFSALVITAVFVFIVLLSTMQHLHNKTRAFRYSVFAVLSSGPFFGAVGTVTDLDRVRQVVVPLCFLCHALFWLLALLLTHHPTTLRDDTLLSGGGFWAEGQTGSALAATDSGCDLGQIGNRGGRHKESGWQEQHGQHQQADVEAADDQMRRRRGDWDAAVPEGCCGMPWKMDALIGEAGRKNSSKRAAASAYLSGDRQPTVGTADSHCPDHWPTDDVEFDEKASGTKLHISHLMKLTLLVSLLLWLLLFGWAVNAFWIGPSTLQARPIDVQWPGPLFHPESVACVGGRVFTADRFRVFELSLEGPARPVACSLRRPITDLAAGCDAAHGCRPLVLASGSAAGDYSTPSQVVACGNSSQADSWQLLQDNVPAELLTVSAPNGVTGDLQEQRLITSRKGELVQHMWSAEEEGPRGWMPEWSLGSISPSGNQLDAERTEALVALGATASRLLAFRDALPARLQIEVRSLSTLEVLGRWRLPKEALPLASGCAWTSSSALVLRRSAAGEPPRLFSVELP
mmetsp:Transcript_103505/g.302025  ORF Transcript_103505/g.302025 Transcript_103505/m.302025 type:complete len:792 (-) Transcript_103505:8-2383(-)